MLDNIELIIVGAVAAVLGSASTWFVFRIRHWIAWRWRRYRAGRDQRRFEREQYLNEYVELTTGEFMHRGCAGSKDEIKSEGIVPLGSCVRCGEHGRSPRAKV